MQAVEVYSHLNGQEFILVHHPNIWRELNDVISNVDAAQCRTKISKEARKVGKSLFSPIEMNVGYKTLLNKLGWQESRTSYWVTSDRELIRATMNLPADQQRSLIQAGGKEPIYTFNQTDFVKDRIAVEVQFGKYSFVAFDLFVKHMAFYVGDVIDVGVEILPMKALAQDMSSGVAYYERELYNVLRQGRGVPAVPLVLVGVGP